MATETFYDLSPLDGNGQAFPFSQLRGKVVLIVNVASKCGFTNQYRELETLYRDLKDHGLVILGFPCNQFGSQEPGTDEEIAMFCQTKFGVSFPVLKKIDVNGPNAEPVYKFLKSKKSGALGFSGVKWNFEKFLVSPEGEVVDRWGSTTSPASLRKPIEGLLPR